jgi:succinate-semialdehyde dehydrogenase / glutarate-semialdehyde dehydrogenase
VICGVGFFYCLIGRKSTPKDKNMAYQSVNPYDGKVVKSFQIMSDVELEAALAAADTCFESWPSTSFKQKATIASKAAGILRSRADDFARLATLEMGKLIEEARGEVLLSADILAYYDKNAKCYLAPETLSPSSGQAEVISTPLGILPRVQPWNFTYYQLLRFAAPRLMAGNLVMVKHSACVPQCAIAFEKLWLDAGALVGAYTNVILSYDQVNQVIDVFRIKGVVLTGSEGAGRSVAERAGQNLKKPTMGS